MLKKDLLSGNSSTLIHIIILIVIVLTVLVPFSAKPFHIDDPMFLWTAKHVQNNPVNFYGFDVNWLDDAKFPMPYSMKNPPLVSYYIALVAFIFGWGERAIHLAMTAPAAAAAAGTYFIAKRFCSRPLLASLIGVLTPVFIVSGTTVMSDITMLAFWCWATVLWMHGTEKDNPVVLAAAALLIAMSALTKYFGMSLIPLLTAYSIYCRKKLSRHVVFMIIPILILAGYQWTTHEMYGRGLLFDAAGYAVGQRPRGGMGYLQNGFIGSVFLGGCVIPALFFAPFLWSRRMMIFWASMTVAIGLALIVGINKMGVTPIMEDGHLRWHSIIQISLFAIAGVSTMALSIGEFLRRRDPFAFLLVLWVLGTFVFASLLNWTISARAILPAAPAAGLIFARKMENEGKDGGARLRLYATLIPGLLIAVSVAWADYRFAESARSAAYDVYTRYATKAGTIWFQGHWGFQYYMESLGAKAIDRRESLIARGDIVVVPMNNQVLETLPASLFPFVDDLHYTPSWRLATMGALTFATRTQAGFYSSDFAVLPYSVGPQFEDVYLVKYASDRIRLRQRIMVTE